MNDLPSGWTKATVADVAASMFDGPFGSALKSSDYTPDGVRVARLENIGHLRFRDDLRSYVSQQKFETLARHTLRARDVLFSSFVDKQTRVCLVPDALDGRMINKADCFCIRPDALVCDASWLAYALASPTSYETFRSSVRGVTRPRIGLRDLGAFSLNLPPLAEQRRIVAKLDALSARTSRARADLDRIPVLAERQRRALLSAAFGGALTPEDAAGAWARRSIGSLIDGITGGKNLRCEERPPAPNELGVVKVSAVTWGRFNPEAAKTLPSTFSPPTRTLIRDGDLLISRANTLELVGAVALVADAPGNLYLSDKVLRLEMPDEHKRWLMWFLRSPEGRAAIEARATGNQLSMRNLSQDALRAIEVPWPEASVRQDLVSRIEATFAEIERLVIEASVARRLLDQLDGAMLAKAFRGELVPQDPADEPASVLLNRMRSDRETSLNVRRVSTTTRSVGRALGEPHMSKSRQDDDVRSKPYLAALLRQSGSLTTESLFKASDLPIPDFYKQLDWELEAGHITEVGETLRAA